MNEDMDTWRKLIKEALPDGEELMACTLSEVELDIEFDADYVGGGRPFTAWSENYVYFPSCYDGHEWVGRVPRNPCGIATKSQGGESMDYDYQVLFI